jgi:hypothetical protein
MCFICPANLIFQGLISKTIQQTNQVTNQQTN